MKLDDGMRFCPGCGAPCAPAQMLQPTAPQPEQQPYQQGQWLTPEPAKRDRYVIHENAGQQPIYAKPDDPAVPEEKSRMGLGIGITVTIILLIAALITAAVLTVFVWKPWESKTPDGPQEILDKFGDYELGTFGEEEYMDLYYEYHYAKESAKRTQLHSLIVWPMDEIRADRIERYGDDVSITNTINSQITLDGTERQEILDYVAQYADTSKIEEIVRVYGTGKYAGSRDSWTMDFFSGEGMIFIKAEGKWYASSYALEKMRTEEN